MAPCKTASGVAGNLANLCREQTVYWRVSFLALFFPANNLLAKGTKPAKQVGGLVPFARLQAVIPNHQFV